MDTFSLLGVGTSHQGDAPVQPPVPPARNDNGTESAAGPSRQKATQASGVLACVACKRLKMRNPLSLLAAVSDDKRPEGVTSTLPSPHHHAEQVADLLEGELDPHLAALGVDRTSCKASLLSVMAPQLLKGEEHDYFSRPHFLAVRDLSEDYDPIHLGLVSEAEVMLFFHTFFSSLHPMNPTLCPLIHSAAYVRSRSMFLFSTILFLGALYTPDSGPAAKRLRMHVERLAHQVAVKHFRSLEIVQAYITYLCWQPPPLKANEDRLYFTGVSSHHLDDDTVGRLVRNRERCWLRLFLWHSAVAVSTGNAATIIEDDLLRDSNWWNHPLASPSDRITCALITLSVEVKYRLKRGSDRGTAWIAPFIDSVLDPWKEKWLPAERHQASYLSLIHRHGRLWVLSTGLDSQYGTAEERQACIDDCLNSALHCCKQGLEDLRAPNYLWYLTNSGVVMLAYSASLALRLFTCRDGYNSTASHATLLGLIASLSLTLDRMGSTPPHRFGLSSLYGRQLQRVIRNRAFALRKAHETQESALPLPDFSDFVMTSMSGFVDGSWDWLMGGETNLGVQEQQLPTDWGVPLDGLQF
ncbi:hypothetical protein JCM10207_007174 [Rhodosporidiobolus poonsookiae]